MINNTAKVMFAIGLFFLTSIASAASGTVKWYNDDKGYGFITPDDGGKDVFVHHDDISSNQTLQEGQRVEYDVVTEQGKVKAEIK